MLAAALRRVGAAGRRHRLGPLRQHRLAAGLHHRETREPSPTELPPVVLTPPTQLHSLGGLTGLMEQTRKRFGDTMGYRLRDLPDVRLTRSRRTRPTTAACCPTTTAAAGAIRRAPPRAPPTDRSRRPRASSTSRPPSASCAVPRRRCTSSSPTSKTTYLIIEPGTRPDGARRIDVVAVRLQRLRSGFDRSSPVTAPPSG